MSFKLDHISISQYGTWSKCQLQWYFRYIEGLRIPPRSVMIVGSGVHSGTESIYRQKKTFDNYKLDEALDATRDYIEYADTKEEVDWDKPKSDAKDIAIKMLKVYSTDVRLPDQVQNQDIEAIEVPLNIRLKRGKSEVIIKARPDLVLKDEIKDIKTTSKTPSNIPMSVILQTHLYATALKKSNTSVDYIVRKAKPTAFSREISKVNKDGMIIVQNLLIDFWEDLQVKIKSGNFLPTGISADSWVCDYCGFGRTGKCKYAKIGKNTKKIESK